MFAGSHQVRIDEKGRLAIPAGLRRQLPEGSYISLGQDRVLAIYPPDQWELLVNNLQDPLLGEAERTLARALFSSAVGCEFDAQGRVMLSPRQRTILGVAAPASVAVIGNGAHVEIWSSERWEGYSEDAVDRFTELADKVVAGHD